MRQRLQRPKSDISIKKKLSGGYFYAMRGAGGDGVPRGTPPTLVLLLSSRMRVCFAFLFPLSWFRLLPRRYPLPLPADSQRFGLRECGLLGCVAVAF